MDKEDSEDISLDSEDGALKDGESEEEEEY